MSYLVHIQSEPIYMAESYSDAVVMVQQQLGSCVIGHPGDIPDGGNRTLVWLTEDDAEGDDGSQAIATICVRGGGL